MAERILEQNRILQATLRNRTARLQDREVRIKAFHLLLLLVRDHLVRGTKRKARGPKRTSILEQIDSALYASDLSDVAFPELGFVNEVSGVERDAHGRVRRSAPDDPWIPPSTNSHLSRRPPTLTPKSALWTPNGACPGGLRSSMTSTRHAPATSRRRTLPRAVGIRCVKSESKPPVALSPTTSAIAWQERPAPGSLQGPRHRRLGGVRRGSPERLSSVAMVPADSGRAGASASERERARALVGTPARRYPLSRSRAADAAQPWCVSCQ